MHPTAFYYPMMHPGKALMKRALLTWDHVEVWSDDVPGCGCMDDPEFREAWHEVCIPVQMTDANRSELHARLEKFLEAGIPDSLRIDPSSEGFFESGYRLVDWRLNGTRLRDDEHLRNLLLDAQLVYRRDGDIFIPNRNLEIVHALFADIRAGVMRGRITDHNEAFEGWNTLLAGETPTDQMPLDLPDHPELLVTIALETVNLENVSLRQLVDLHRRHKDNAEMIELRYAFAKHLDEVVRDLTDNRRPKDPDWEEIARLYRSRANRHMKDLREALKLEDQQMFLSKTWLVPVLVPISELLGQKLDTSPIVAGAVLSIAGLLSLIIKRRANRHKIVSESPLGYIYEIADEGSLSH
jgi:hypothetical protein